MRPPCRFLAATARHPAVLQMVESLLGPGVKMPSRSRGLYCVWPTSCPTRQIGPHIDSQSEELLATTYLGTVGPADGGFTVWSAHGGSVISSCGREGGGGGSLRAPSCIVPQQASDRFAWAC